MRPTVTPIEPSLVPVVRVVSTVETPPESITVPVKNLMAR